AASISGLRSMMFDPVMSKFQSCAGFRRDEVFQPVSRRDWPERQRFAAVFLAAPQSRSYVRAHQGVLNAFADAA
ncbi:hypothetical protein, partial [Mesorhizobium sp. M8A.F.Ca.ET.182.01.1.1]|uniref:hypothetical protein n=1 Tax=Mesorhizobium sp. M8A.F.Ca.ET.182.01.1.1 TaxID=2563964 RepID=UPI001AEF1760